MNEHEGVILNGRLDDETIQHYRKTCAQERRGAKGKGSRLIYG